jgi:tuftelin-interacting protein 11
MSSSSGDAAAARARGSDDDAWDCGEFNSRGGLGSSAPRGGRSRADEALYGYESSGEDERRGGERSKRARRDGDDRGAPEPVGFVSAAATRAPDPAASPPRRVGLGARPTAAIPPPPPAAGGDDGVLPGAFGARVKRAAAARAAAAPPPASRAPPVPPPHAGPPAADIGVFERHTKGIGAKLLSKMGYVPGRGLGAGGQGIARPIEAVQRPRGAGLGVGKTRAPAELAAPTAPGAGRKAAAAAAAGASTQAEIDAATKKLWKKRDAPARAKRAFRSAAEVAADAARRPAPGAPILDMRGAVPVLVADAGALGGDGRGGGGFDESVPLPEFQHNLRLLADMAAADVAKHDAAAACEGDTVAALEAEAARGRAGAERASVAAARLRSLAAQARAAVADPSPDAFAALKADAGAEYGSHGLAAAAGAAALAALDSALAAWDPLADPTRGAADALAWRPLAEAPAHSSEGLQGCPFEAAVGASVARRAAAALATRWAPTDSEPALALVEAWEAALPPRCLASLLEGSVLPRLAAAVASWRPAADPTPPHAWLHPWLPWLPHRLPDLWPPVRHKLASALGAWHPRDASALALLRPWRAVFADSDWDRLIEGAILPRLGWALGEALEINPAAQDLGAWHWAARWAPDLRPRTLARLLATAFFPKWHSALRAWLASPGVDYGEVAAWYEGWKALLPPSVADAAPVRAQLAAGLDAMNAVLGGVAVADLPPPPGADEGAGGEAAAAPPPLRAAPPPSSTDPGFRALVEAFADAAGLALVPAPAAARAAVGGLPVFALGRVRVALDAARGTLLAQVGGEWGPASLEDVLKEHGRREASAGGGG